MEEKGVVGIPCPSQVSKGHDLSWTVCLIFFFFLVCISSPVGSNRIYIGPSLYLCETVKGMSSSLQGNIHLSFSKWKTFCKNAVYMSGESLFLHTFVVGQV